jgi:hypothetical protein
MPAPSLDRLSDESLATGSYAFVRSAEDQAKVVDSVSDELLTAGADQRHAQPR